MKLSKGFAAAVAALVLVGCGHHEASMKVQLDKIRSMVAQGAVMSVQAACAEPAVRADMVHAAVVMLRRATAGPEMAKIHKMMGQMTMDTPGSTPTTAKNMDLSPDEKMHLAVHAAGGDAFDLLDAVTQPPALTCAEVRPVSLAAAAALLRQHHEVSDDAATAKLDREVDASAKQLDDQVRQSITDKTPEVVRTLALALQQI